MAMKDQIKRKENIEILLRSARAGAMVIISCNTGSALDALEAAGAHPERALNQQCSKHIFIDIRKVSGRVRKAAL